MKPRPLGAWPALLVLCSLSARAHADGEAAAFAGLLAKHIKPDAPGCAVTITRRGAPPLGRVWGLADLERPLALRAESVFEAGSVSKQFTAAALAWLAARGRLSLDDDVRRYVPELPDYGATITVRMLLHHTSGLRDWGDIAELSGWPRGTQARRQADALRLITRQRALNFPPGSQYRYSNSNYVVATVVAARVSGQPFEALTGQSLFVPLGMAHTRWRGDFRTVVRGRAQAYSSNQPGRWELDMPFEDVIGHAGLLTTVDDLVAWSAALDHPRPEDAAWVNLMHTPGTLTDGTRTRYALGIQTAPFHGEPAFTHGGATAGYRSFLGRLPRRGVSVALLCNNGDINSEELGEQLLGLFVAAPAPAQAEPRASGDPAWLGGLAGGYRVETQDSAIEVVVEGGRVRFGKGGAPFLAVSPERLQSEDGTREARIERLGSATVRRIVLTRVGNSPTVLVPAPSWSPNAAVLAALAGSYESEEVDGVQRLVLRDGKLRWVDPAQREQVLTPLYAQGLVAADSGAILRFARDGRGRVSEFTLSQGRAQGVRFTRHDR